MSERDTKNGEEKTSIPCRDSRLYYKRTAIRILQLLVSIQTIKKEIKIQIILLGRAVLEGFLHFRPNIYSTTLLPAECRGKATKHSLPSPSTIQNDHGRYQSFSNTRLHSRKSPKHKYPETEWFYFNNTVLSPVILSTSNNLIFCSVLKQNLKADVFSF